MPDTTPAIRIIGCPVPNCESWAATHDGANPSLWSHELPVLDGATFLVQPVRSGNEPWKLNVELPDQLLDAQQLRQLIALLWAEGIRLAFLAEPATDVGAIAQAEYDLRLGSDASISSGQTVLRGASISVVHVGE